jgi:hypothetical protein
MYHNVALAGSRGLSAVLDLERGLDLADLREHAGKYAIASAYDGSLLRLKHRIGAALELEKADHRSALLTWLRQWGCRHLNRASEATSAAALHAWADAWVPLLPAPGHSLADLSADDTVTLAVAYGQLAGTVAGERRLAKGPARVTFGPTAAAKTMYALRPGSCAPWDDPIRHALGMAGNDAAYRWYLQLIAQALTKTAGRAGVAAVDLPSLAGRPGSSPPKLIDEYLWMRITRGAARDLPLPGTGPMCGGSCAGTRPRRSQHRTYRSLKVRCAYPNRLILSSTVSEGMLGSAA